MHMCTVCEHVCVPYGTIQCAVFVLHLLLSAGVAPIEVLQALAHSGREVMCGLQVGCRSSVAALQALLAIYQCKRTAVIGTPSATLKVQGVT